MTIEELPSGSYRIKQMYKGTYYSITVPYKPTKKEATILMAERLQTETPKGKPRSFGDCLASYIADRENVLSPSTIRSYYTLQRSFQKDFLAILMSDLNNEDIQRELNSYSTSHSSKSVRNMSGLITAVVKVYKPNMMVHVSLPQKQVTKYTRASTNDVAKLLEETEGTEYHVAFQLGVLGLRRGEVCGLSLDDLGEDNVLTIHRVMVEDKDFHWVYKDVPKNETSHRQIKLAEKLANEIRQQGFICKVTPPMLVYTLHGYQEKLGLPHFRFHDLRAYCVSYLHLNGYPDKYIQNFCGYKTNYTMDKVYKEVMEDQLMSIKEDMVKTLL